MMPDERFVDVPGGRIFAVMWGEGPTLVFTHATGMCGCVYRALLEPLASRFRLVVPDARGHGRTELEAIPGRIPTDWKLYRDDLRALVVALGGGPVRLAGHSFGATVAFEAAVETPGLASAVCLIDPPFIPFAHVGRYRSVRAADALPENPMADQAERRRGHFPSRAAARAAYYGRGVFRDWPDGALDAYLDGGLRPDPRDGEPDGVRLACAPAWEATSFRGVSTTFGESLKAARLPFSVVAAGEGSTVPTEEEAVIRHHPFGRIERIAGAGHFLPVTHPDAVRPFLEALA